MQKAKALSQELGDRRSRALIYLHLGRLHYFGNRIPEAIGAFSEGKAEVEDLGDEDIRIEAAEFIGMYYFIQGRFSEARPHFQEAARSLDGPYIYPHRCGWPSAPSILASSTMQLVRLITTIAWRW